MKILSVADALAAMDYLHKRELLCERCGINLSVVQNINHAYCVGCKPVHGDYAPVVPPNKLEVHLCEAIREWLENAQ